MDYSKTQNTVAVQFEKRGGVGQLLQSDPSSLCLGGKHKLSVLGRSYDDQE